MFYVDNSYYDGDFVEDERTGKGHIVYANQDVYTGDWVDG